MKNNALIILHEIYGINGFIKEQKEKYEKEGYMVICPDMLGRKPFLYQEAGEAYQYFQEKAGFLAYRDINILVEQQKSCGRNVFILGFSVGATIAWRCSENPLLSGVIACYGSRIRDYTQVNPVCSTLVIFAKQEPFDVRNLSLGLAGKKKVTVQEYDVGHGFMDCNSIHYNQQAKDSAERAIHSFFKANG